MSSKKFPVNQSTCSKESIIKGTCDPRASNIQNSSSNYKNPNNPCYGKGSPYPNAQVAQANQTNHGHTKK